jgi:hypothetical protein
MREIVIGALAMGFAVAGMFFLRFWRETRDRLFAFFALAFFVLSINRVGFAFFSDSDIRGDYLYWVRLVAFTIILLAVVDKNIKRSPSGND